MSVRGYTGSCQCGRVQFEATIDLETQLQKREGRAALGGGLSHFVLIRPQAFKLLSGEDDLADTQFGTVLSLNRFCRYCGVRLFGVGHLARLGGDFCAVSLAAIDGIVRQSPQSREDVVGEPQANAAAP